MEVIRDLKSGVTIVKRTDQENLVEPRIEDIDRIIESATAKSPLLGKFTRTIYQSDIQKSKIKIFFKPHS